MPACVSIGVPCNPSDGFLAVGESDDARRMTGYQSHWSRWPDWTPPGRPRDVVLVSWSQPPAGAMHCCYDHWHIVLNSLRNGGRPHELIVELKDAVARSSHAASLVISVGEVRP